MSFKNAEWSDGDDENSHISSVVWFFNTTVVLDLHRIVKITLTSKEEFVARFKNTSSGTESTFTRSRAEIVFYDRRGQEFTVDALDINNIELIEDLDIIQNFSE